jgi:hypothetical protein
MIVESERFCAPKERTRGRCSRFYAEQCSRLAFSIKYTLRRDQILADIFDRLLRHQTASSRQSSNPRRRVRCTVLQYIHASYIHRHRNKHSASPTRRGPISSLEHIHHPAKKPKEEKRVPLLPFLEDCVRHQSRRSRTHAEQWKSSFIIFQAPRSPLHLRYYSEWQEYKCRFRRLTAAVSPLSRGAKNSQSHSIEEPMNPKMRLYAAAFERPHPFLGLHRLPRQSASMTTSGLS